MSKGREVMPGTDTIKFVIEPGADWVDAGPGPLLIMGTHSTIFAVAAAKPTLPPGEGFRLNGWQTFYIQSGEHVWLSCVAEPDLESSIVYVGAG